MANRKALGRGIKALIPDTTDTEIRDPAGSGIDELEVNRIRANPYQPRVEFAPQALEDLKNSIRTNGIISPVIVRRAAGGFELIAGERRFRAVQDLGYAKIPAIIRDIESESEMLELSLIENIQREQLIPIEEARSYKSLISTYHYTQEQLAERVGKKRSTITNFLRLLNLSDQTQDLIFHGQLSMGHARAILGISDVNGQDRLAGMTVRKGLSVREVEKLAGENGGRKAPPGKTAGPGRFFSLEEDLKRRFGTKVAIRERNGKGRVEIAFYSEDDLDRIVELLNG